MFPQASQSVNSALLKHKGVAFQFTTTQKQMSPLKIQITACECPSYQVCLMFLKNTAKTSNNVVQKLRTPLKYSTTNCLEMKGN